MIIYCNRTEDLDKPGQRPWDVGAVVGSRRQLVKANGKFMLTDHGQDE